ncbi:MAG: hypothetical protein A2544_00580 [Candidatus Zambryskibacteria bacterium RIFOXYD2_FULL_43_10]|uniref:Addiction module toxin RelE n=1 Tax=Candidatus Zambryskibacteria bacterium RIFOXYD2_FULL_43_10 TaxID=1802782 RepID=A0A1G2V8Y0_9BACT|nr:MAG: hypothetical protein A2544_00580 [Candidatus Zambryskibacteria bacterium RIFOXYD2_FULL_43_10]
MRRILLHNLITKDLELCKKKKWHNGLDEELPRVYKLLKIDSNLPGESPIKHLGEKWGGKIKHAYVALPKENCGGRNGGRVVYIVESDKCRVIYVGGHKDKRYDKQHSLSELILERIEDSLWTEWIDDQD